MSLADHTFFVAGIACAVVTGYLVLTNSWKAIAKEELQVFSSEHEAAYAGSLSLNTEPAISIVKQGEEVTVLWDTYGKDYWACYIQTLANQRGCVLCTSLQQLASIHLAKSIMIATSLHTVMPNPEVNWVTE